MHRRDESLVVAALAAKYPIFAESTIRRWVSKENDRYATARVQTYIAVLVQRAVDATLSELARTEGTSADQLTLDVPAEGAQAFSR